VVFLNAPHSFSHVSNYGDCENGTLLSSGILQTMHYGAFAQGKVSSYAHINTFFCASVEFPLRGKFIPKIINVYDFNDFGGSKPTFLN